MAPEVGLEPTTLRLTAECSAIELLRNIAYVPRLWTSPHNSSTIANRGGWVKRLVALPVRRADDRRCSLKVVRRELRGSEGGVVGVRGEAAHQELLDHILQSGCSDANGCAFEDEARATAVDGGIVEVRQG